MADIYKEFRGLQPKEVEDSVNAWLEDNPRVRVTSLKRDSDGSTVTVSLIGRVEPLPDYGFGGGYG